MDLLDFKQKVSHPLRIATLVFLVKKDLVLLALKKKGFGEGKWNGVGGKVKTGESVEEAAARETKEEIGVELVNFRQMAALDFYFPLVPIAKDWNQRVIVYLADEWVDNPSESEEMAPKWFINGNLPFADMWPDDLIWLPKVLAGEKITAEFFFGKNDAILKYNMKKEL